VNYDKMYTFKFENYCLLHEAPYSYFMNFTLSITIIAFAILQSCHPNPTGLIQNELDEISRRWVPDKRVGICNFTLEEGQKNEMVLKGETIFPKAKEEVLRLLASKSITFVDSVAILPDTIRTDKCWGIIALSVANLRSKPAHSAELVTQAIMGTPVRILKEDGGWILVQTPELYIAWTNVSSVEQMNLTTINNWRHADRIIYTDTYGMVYKDSKLKMVMSDLVAGAIVVKKSTKQNLIEVILPNGSSGFVSNPNWLSFKQWKDTLSLTGDHIAEIGERFLGFPYMWGGTSSKAMDCSGLVKTVYFLNGVILERDASQQIKHGKELNITNGSDKLQKGDLLFFGSKNPYRVLHVGIYIGNNQIIHSSGSVQISGIDPNNGNYCNRLNAEFLGARRIIGSLSESGNWPIKSHNWY
jgi:hypothetical protein